MSTNIKLAHQRQQKIQTYAKNSDSYSFFNLLTSPELLSRVETVLPEHRERLYPPTETLSMFLAQALSEDRSCQKVVNDAAVKRVIGGLPRVSTTTGGYCRARQRLLTSMVSELTLQTNELIEVQSREEWKWRGKRVCLIDGTTVTLPDTEENQRRYPQPSVQKPGLGFPICRIVGVISLSSGAVVNASLGPCQGKGSDEQSLLRNILETFESGDLILGDAFFGTWFLLAALLDKGVDAVFEQMGVRKLITDFRKGKQLGSRDHLVELPKSKKKPDWMSQEYYDNAPDILTIRELKVGGKTIITTLLSAKEVSKKEIKELYKRRWHIEMDFRDIKTTLGMETLSCKSPDMIEKEMWIYFLAYNLICLLMVQSASLVGLLPRQISFKHTVQMWLAWSQQNAVTEDESNAQLLILIAQQQVGKRPGRIEPRAVKRRPKPFPLLMKPRVEARTEIRKIGHPKKLK